MRFVPLTFAATLLVLWVVGGVGPASGQDFPCRSITLVVDSGVGSGSDVVMRAFAERFNRGGGTLPPMRVINRIGEDTLAEVAASPPTGCRLIAVTQSIVAERLARASRVEWKNLVPVAALARAPLVLAARTGLEPKPLPELIETVRNEPGKIVLGESPNVLERFVLRAFEDAAGVSFGRTSFETTRQRYTALLSGSLDLAFVSVVGALRRFEEGELIPLGVTSRDRFPAAGQVPTLAEQGVPLDVTIDRGVMAPLGTPEDRVEALAAALEKAAGDEGLQAALQAQGTWVRFLGPEAFTRYLENLTADWRELLERTGRGTSPRGRS